MYHIFQPVICILCARKVLNFLLLYASVNNISFFFFFPLQVINWDNMRRAYVFHIQEQVVSADFCNVSWENIFHIVVLNQVKIPFPAEG